MTPTDRIREWMSRSSLRLALVVSLFLHFILGGWMVLRPPEPPVENRPGEIWFEEVAPPKKPKPPEEAKKPQPEDKEAAKKKKKVAVSDRPPPEATITESSPPARSDAPSADSPRAAPAPNLFPPQIALSPGGSIAVEPSRGETVHPDDPRFSKDVIAAKEKQLVTGRVQAWTGDELAEARAQRGLPHPYLMALRGAGMKGLDKMAREKGLRAPAGLQARALADRYSDSASSYAKTGDPGLGPPGQAPRPSEGMTQPEMAPLRALSQATETFNDLSHGKPLLTLTLEFRQTKDNHNKTAVIKASIDPAFDAFVLEAWPLSVAAAGTPPPDAFHSDELRTIWEVEGWPGQSKLDKTMTYLPSAGVMGVPLTSLVPHAIDGVTYEFRARLLRVY
jgi:hypothetical protein